MRLTTNHKFKIALEDQSAFTLIELLVVSVLLALLASILYGTITNIIQGRSLVKGQLETTRTGQYLLERMGRELASAMIMPVVINDPQGQVKSSTTLGSRTVFLGVNKKSDSVDKDEIAFISSNGAQLLSDHSSNFGTVQIEYRLKEASSELIENEDDDEKPKTFWLSRTETPAGVQNKKLLEARRFEYPIAKNVSSLNFRYLQEGKWQNTWGSGNSALPEAIEISISLVDSEGNVEVLRTAYAIKKKE